VSKSTIGATPDRNAVISIAMVDEHLFTRESITKSLTDLCSLFDIVAFARCEDCLRSPRTHDLILYHVHDRIAKLDNDQHFRNIKGLLEIAPVIVLCNANCIESIAAAFESGVHGYIPTASTTLKQTVEIIHFVKAGGTFVPPSTLGVQVGRGRSVILSAITRGQFTARQMAVLGRLKLGKTNRMIARELDMSESTVKVHIRNIMRVLNATNRTEVASRIHELEMSGARSFD
jgi:DNA-binding NarL/FixJ family response regulator